MSLFKKEKTLDFERVYAAPADAVWRAWTEPDLVRQWWGPEKTAVAECEVDARVGGRIHIVTEATEEMGKYAGTRWPMSGTFTAVQEGARLAWDARSWTEGEEDTTTIVHTNDVTITEDGGKTTVVMHVRIPEIGSGAKLAAFGMKWGYRQYLDKLDEFLARSSS